MTTFPLGSIEVAPVLRNGWEAKTPGIGLPFGVLLVSEAVDPLVAGRAAVVAGHVLEVVVDRQVGQADLLDLGGRGGHVDAGKAAEPGEQAEVLGVLLVDQPLHPVDLAGELLAILLELVDEAQQLFLLGGLAP